MMKYPAFLMKKTTGCKVLPQKKRIAKLVNITPINFFLVDMIIYVDMSNWGMGVIKANLLLGAYHLVNG